MRVLISGAGIAGPTLAYFLAKTGANITIIEKNTAHLPHGQSIDLKGSAIKVIEKMGLMDQYRKAHTKELGTHFVNSNGQPFASFPITGESSASPTSKYEILRGDLAAILHDATRNLPNVNYLFGTTIKEVVSNDDESVKVDFGEGDVQEFDLLVAADGQWSKVRKQCFPLECVQAVHRGMYAVYYTVPRIPSDNDWWNIYLAPGSKTIGLRPDPHGTMRAFFTHMPCDKFEEVMWEKASRSGREVQEALLKRTFANAGWQAQRFLDCTSRAPDFYFHVIQQIKMSEWSRSRVVCLGDTAYCPSPLTGSGTSLAIIGAYVLAGELGSLEAGEKPSKALEAYESRFRPFVEEVQKIPFFMPAVIHPNAVWKKWLVESFIRVIAMVVAIPWIASCLGNEEDDDSFPLPGYSCFDGEKSK